MGVRVIGVVFTGDTHDLDAALARSEASIKAFHERAAAASRTSVQAGKQAADQQAKTAGATAQAAQQQSAADQQVASSSTRRVTGSRAVASAEQTAAAAAVRASDTQEKAAAKAVVAVEKEAAAARASAAAQTAAAEAAADPADAAAARRAAAAQRAADAATAAAERAAAAQVEADRVSARSAETAAAKRIAADRAAADAEVADSHRRAGAAGEIGGRLLLAGAITGAGIGLAVKQFADFDAAMSKAAAGTDATGRQLDNLRQAALQAGAATQFTASEAADAETALGKAGVSVADILGGGLKGSLDLAAAGQLDVGQSAEIAATAMTQFGLAGKDLPHVADLLAAGAGKAQGEVTDLANALQYVGPVAKGLNVSIEETVGTLAELASQGIVSEQAGTSLRGLLLSLTSPSMKAADEMKALGLNLYDAKGQFVGLAGVAGQLHEALGGMSAAQRDAALGVIFGNEQVTAARVLYEGGSKAVEDWTKKVNDSGFAARQAAKLTDNLRGDIERLGGSLSTVFIQTGSGSNGFLRGVVQEVQHAVDTFGRLPVGVQQGTLALLGVSAVALIVTGGILKVVSTVNKAKTAIAEMGITSEGAAGKMLTLGKASGYLALYIGATQALGALAPKVEDSAVSTGHMADALARVAQGLKAGDVGSLGQNFDDIGKKLKDLSDPSANARYEDFESSLSSIATFGAFGSSKGRNDRRLFLADLDGLDKSLAGLVSSGHTDQAVAAFDAINNKAVAAGVGTDQLKSHLPGFTDALDQAHAAAAGTASGVGAIKTSIDGLGTAAEAEATRLNDALDEAEKAVRKSFTSDSQVIDNFKPDDGSAQKSAADKLKDAKERLADSEAEVADRRKRASDKNKATSVSDLQQLKHEREAVSDAQKDVGKAKADAAANSLTGQYAAALKNTKQFTEDITAAFNRGLDPKIVQRLLQEGPAKAGPVLRQLVADHSGRLIKMVDDSEKKLGELTDLAAEQARLTARAVAAPTDKLSGEIGDAMRIAQAKAETGGKATAGALAKSLKLPKDQVEKIAADFGIELADGVQRAVDSKPVVVSATGVIKYKDSSGHTVQLKTKAGDKGLREGGQVLGGSGHPTADDIPTFLSHREYVHPVRAVDHYGLAFMEDIRALRLPRPRKLATGGLAGRDGAPGTSWPGGWAGPAPVQQPPGASRIQVIPVRVPVRETHTVQQGDVHHHQMSVAKVVTQDAHSFAKWTEATAAYGGRR